MTEKENLDRITQDIIGASIQVHQTLGPGLLESAYQACLVFELAERGHQLETEKPLPIIYKSLALDCAYRIDILVDNQVIVEVKAVDRLIPIQQAQLLSYLKLSGCKIGLLINFNVKLLKDGVQRIINGIID